LDFAANALATDIWYLVKFDFVLVSTGEHSLKVLMSLLYAIWRTAGILVSAVSLSGGLQHQAAAAGVLACTAMVLGVASVNGTYFASACDSASASASAAQAVAAAVTVAAATAVAAAKVTDQSVAQSKVLCFEAATDHLPRMLRVFPFLADATPSYAN